MDDAGHARAVINLATGHEDVDRVTVAFLVATAGQTKGREVVMFLTKEAVRIAVPGYAAAIASAGAPPVSRLFAQFQEAGGMFYACPICLDARNIPHDGLVPNARAAGATPLWDFIGDDTPVFSY